MNSSQDNKIWYIPALQLLGAVLVSYLITGSSRAWTHREGEKKKKDKNSVWLFDILTSTYHT